MGGADIGDGLAAKPGVAIIMRAVPPWARRSQPDAEARRAFLLAAIQNTHTTIVSIEGRVPMALILHGLLFAGLVSVTLSITKAIWQDPLFRWLFIVELAPALVAFLLSVLAFIQCVMPPGDTTTMTDRTLGLGEADPYLFFPAWRAHWEWSRSGPHLKLTSTRSLQGAEFSERYALIARFTTDEVDKILSAELLAISTFRGYKSTFNRYGFRWLRIEIVLALSYLVTLAIAHSVHAP